MMARGCFLWGTIATMTDSKLARFCAAVMEGGWLAAIVTTPLFFNVYSDRIFEVEKTAVLRSIALVMGVAWLAAWAGRQPWQAREALVAGWQSAVRAALRNHYPLLLPVLLLVIAYLLAFAFSVDRHVSWAGSYRRGQGVYTMLAYVVIFGVTATSMRSQAQLERAITCIILTTIPITLYAGLQRYDLDPIPWSGGWQVRVQLRVIGQLGHPIFVAAYLMMGFLLTAARWVENVLRIPYSVLKKEAGDTEYGIRNTIVATLLYSLILLLQLIAILWSGSRGPLLGLAAGIAVLAALLVALLRQSGRVSGRVWRGLTAVAVVGVILLLAFLVLFNLPAERTATYRGAPLLGGLLARMDGWRDQPTLGRFGRLLEVGTGSGRVRVLIWQGMSDLVRPHYALPFSPDDRDPYNSLRPLVGYGPDTLYLVYNRFYQPEIASLEARNTGIDRAHNETFDLLAFTGVTGLIAWHVLYLGLLAYGLRCLGLLNGRRDLILLVGLWFLAGVVLAYGATLWPGLPYAGVAFPAGNLVGLFLYLLYGAVITLSPGSSPSEGEGEGGRAVAFAGRDRLLMVGLLAAMVAHYVEIQFGIAVVASRTLFFLLAALLVVIGYRLSGEDEEQEVVAAEAAPRRDQRKVGRVTAEAMPDWMGATLVYALPLGMMTAIVAYEFVLLPVGITIRPGAALTTASEIVRRSWLTRNGADSPYIFLLIFATWLLAILLIVVERPEGVVREEEKINPKSQIPNPKSQATNLKSQIPNPKSQRVGGEVSDVLVVALLVGLLGAVVLGVLVGVWAGLLLTAGLGAVLYLQWGRLRHHRLLPIGVLAWLSLAIGLAYSYVHALQLYGASFSSQAASVETQVEKAMQPTQFLTLFYLFVLGGVLLYGLAQLLLGRERDRGVTAGWVVLLGLLPLAFYAIYQSNLRPNQADIVYKQARTLDLQAFQSRQPALLDQAIAVYERAIEMAPREPFYRSFLGLAYLQKASITSDLATQEALWQTAEEQLRLTADQLPLHPDYQLNLARLYATRARLDSDANRTELLATAHEQYSAALNLSPRNGVMWNEYADLVFSLQGNCPEALDLYMASAGGDSFYAKTYVEIAELQLLCDPKGLTAETYDDIAATLRYALFLISQGTTPQQWERLAQQYSDLATFEGALATYEQERSQMWLQASAVLDEADAALRAGDLEETDEQLQEALPLLQELVAQ
jgi:tetratricopeptide (TPR) repeat protein